MRVLNVKCNSVMNQQIRLKGIGDIHVVDGNYKFGKTHFSLEHVDPCTLDQVNHDYDHK